MIHKNQSNKKEIDALVLQHFSMRLSSMNHLLVHVLDLLLICSYCDFFSLYSQIFKRLCRFLEKKITGICNILIKMLNEACYNFFLFSFLPIFPLDKNCVFTLEIFIAKLKKCNILTKHFYTDSIKCNNCFATLQLSCSKGYVCIYVM